jgi:hypothetical protein
MMPAQPLLPRGTQQPRLRAINIFFDTPCRARQMSVTLMPADIAQPPLVICRFSGFSLFASRCQTPPSRFSMDAYFTFRR